MRASKMAKPKIQVTPLKHVVNPLDRVDLFIREGGWYEQNHYLINGHSMQDDEDGKDGKGFQMELRGFTASL